MRLTSNVAHTTCRCVTVRVAYLPAHFLTSMLLYLYFIFYIFSAHIYFLIPLTSALSEMIVCVCVYISVYACIAVGILYSCTARSCSCAILRSSACVEMSADQVQTHNLISSLFIHIYTCGGNMLTTTAFSDFFCALLFCFFLLFCFEIQYTFV